MTEVKKTEVVLEGGTYEILRNRLKEHGASLHQALEKLNTDRREVFGSIEPKLLASQRVTTEHNCVPRDILALGETFLFAYNVHFGLKSTTDLKDVFSVFKKTEKEFEQTTLDLLENKEFLIDFNSLYKYYKHTIFSRFWITDPYLYMVFRIGKNVTDIKTFKWLMKPDNTLEYIDNRSDHEYQYPTQYAFDWVRTNRNNFRDGKCPHISIEDRIFIECVDGDFTIKVEDNTETGEGIFAEQVEDQEQKLDDAEVFYATVGPLILMKVRPYREVAYRYYVYNEKLQEAVRIDSVGQCTQLLPDEQGIIFPNGYYLVSGDYKVFDYPAEDMLFERRNQSPNGEDTLYVFYNREHGNFILLSYNIIDQVVQTPVHCNGYCFFSQGELLYFRSENDPQKHHSVQIWQTPFVSNDYEPPIVNESFLSTIGNKQLVSCMAECQNILNLINRKDVYQSIYNDIYRFVSGLLDSYFWLNRNEVHGLAGVLKSIGEAASAAIDEFEKVRQIQKSTAAQVKTVIGKTNELLKSINPETMGQSDEFIGALAQLRQLRGEIITLKELRYANLTAIEALEDEVVGAVEELSEGCVEFLLRPDALTPYQSMVRVVSGNTEELSKAVDAKPIEEEISRISMEVETMIEVVGNLRIDDATKSTQIIDGCSDILTTLNTARADLRNKKKSLQSKEAVGEFTAQIKLMEQSIVSHLDISDTTEKCSEYENRLLVQIEELEGRFADFDDYVLILIDKRSEVTSAFEARKLALLEEKNRRVNTLAKSADRILKAVTGRVESIKEITAINAYFAADLMIEKVRGIVTELIELGDTVKGDEIQSRLKSTQENAVRQLKDKKDLFAEGDNLIRFGRHLFSTNNQKPELSFLFRDEAMYAHITGTNFFEKVTDPVLEETRSLWDQDYISESRDVYRGEFLAYSMLVKAGTEEIPSRKELQDQTREELLSVVQKYMGPRFNEGYQKGVHDLDGTLLLETLLALYKGADLLRFDSKSRSLARLYWYCLIPIEEKNSLHSLIQGMGQAVKAFGDRHEFQIARQRLCKSLTAFVEETSLYEQVHAQEAAEYLFEELSRREGFIVSPEATLLYEEFTRYLREGHLLDQLERTLETLGDDLAGSIQLLRGWLGGYIVKNPGEYSELAVDETAALIITDSFDRRFLHNTSVSTTLEGLKGSHRRISEGIMTLDFPEFMARLRRYQQHQIPLFRKLHDRKKELAVIYKEDLKLNEFQPRVLTSFVRNRLINEVYLPLIGDNLAKQIGAAGAEKRTDLMGMLLLISPPGYGKTTLMEYIASRLGVIFVKVNGPALGHRVTSLDPTEAPNAAAREEIEKLNLALEMGDNIMIYLDDIQHCNPELLQKFISLCDGQRRIEGVWKGKSRTYDLRGRKVCVVMAGNPYTESGDKFQIPDMLANRADTYNLGDILGNYLDAFETSYIENSLTSNQILSPLAVRSQNDIYALIKLARSGPQSDIDFEGSYSTSEINDFVSVVEKLFRIQDVILKVNKEYIHSAAQEDAYRTEPLFRLQGSYRNMNKLAEKVIPIMNDEELLELIVSHYEGESQTLTTGAESNLLKFREMIGIQTEEEANRWNDIKKTFQRQQKFLGMDSKDSMSQAIMQLGDVASGMGDINTSLGSLGHLSKQMEATGPRLQEVLERLFREPRDSKQEIQFPTSLSTELAEGSQKFLEEVVRRLATSIEDMGKLQLATPSPDQVTMNISDDSIAKLATHLGEMKVQAEFPDLFNLMEEKDPSKRTQRREFIAPGSMRECLEENGFEVDETKKATFTVKRDGNRPIVLRVRNDRLEVRMYVDVDERLAEPGFMQRLLQLNSEILPVAFAMEDVGGRQVLYLLETRDGKDMTRSELVTVLGSMEKASKRVDEFLQG